MTRASNKCPQLTKSKEWFLSHVSIEPNSDCWLWTGRKSGNGYGLVSQAKKPLACYAHRYSWVLFCGQFDGSLNVCHRCDVPLCVNPDHLFLGTQADNLADMTKKKRHMHGENHYAAKLSERDIKQIRSLEGNLNYAKIAKEYGVGPTAIQRIISRESWKNVL